MDHYADEQCIGAGKRARLGGAHDAETDEQDQQDGEHHRPDARDESGEDLLGRSGLVMLGLVAKLAGAPCGGEHQQHTHQDARHPARHKQSPDPHLADRTVDDKPHTGRDGCHDQAGEAVDCGGPAAGIAETEHLRAEDAAFHRSVRHSGTRNAAHQGGEQAGNLADISVHMAGTGVGKPHQAAGDAAAVHQVACEDEQGDCEHGETLGGGDGFLNENGHGEVTDQEKRESGQADREGHRHTEQQEHQENTDCNKHYATSFPASYLIS